MTRRRAYRTGLTLALLLVGVMASSARIALTVTGDRVNLRATQDGESEVVSQVSSGARLFTDSLQGERIAVEAPSDVDLWVYGELVKEGKVAVSKVSVRSGPGINYRPVGTLTRDTAVDVRGSRNDWLKIAAPSSCRLWISSQYVERADAPPVAAAAPQPVTPPTPKLTQPKPVVVSTPVPVSPVVSTPVKPAPRPAPSTPLVAAVPEPVKPKIVNPSRFPDVPASAPGHSVRGAPGPIRVQPPLPANLPETLDPARLVASKVQGKQVTLSGRLSRSGMVWRRPSRYRLVANDSRGRAVTRGYLLSPDQDLGRFLGEEVDLTGKAYWVQGVRDMAVVVDQIKARATAASRTR